MNTRLALIIGATGTLGKAITKKLASQNIQLILASRNIDKLEKLYEQIINISILKPIIITLDLSHGRSIDKLGGKIFEKYKKLDILINCSSFYPKLSPIHHINPKEFSKLININISANWQIIRSFDPLLRLSKYGRAYFFICKRKTYNEPYFGSYVLSSNAIEALIKSWKKEIKKTNIIVSTYDPGPVDGALRNSAFPGENKNNVNTAELSAKHFINLLEKSYTPLT